MLGNILVSEPFILMLIITPSPFDTLVWFLDRMENDGQDSVSD